MIRSVDRLWLGRQAVMVAGDVCVFSLVVALVSQLRGPALPFGQLVTLFVPVLGFCVASAYVAGLYELRLVRDFVALIGGLLGAAGASWVLGTTYFYLQSSGPGLSPKMTLFLVVVGTHVGMLCWRRAVLTVTGFTLFDLKVVILAAADQREYLGSSMGRHRSEEFNVVDIATPDVNLVVVDRRWADRNTDEAYRVLSTAIANRIPVVSIDEFHESLFGKVSPEHASDLVWALDHVLPRSGSPYFAVKRVLDVVLAAVLLLMHLPLMVLVALAIALMDRASPFYGQTRIGYLGRPFRLWKFRTMRPGADCAGPFVPVPFSGDRRVTPLGSFLRRVRIDELPQLWNVLKGDMSLVGPRPEWAEEVRVNEKSVPTYRLRYLVPPGITGWAQVYFRATNNPLDSIEKQNFDLYYLKHLSLALDFSIMLKTIKRVLIHDSRVSSAPIPWPLDHPSESASSIDIGSIVGRGE